VILLKTPSIKSHSTCSIVVDRVSGLCSSKHVRMVGMGVLAMPIMSSVAFRYFFKGNWPDRKEGRLALCHDVIAGL
jgi:hypothetical protein